VGDDDMSENLFDKLNEAITSGNTDEVERIKKQILLGGRDTSIDENFIKSIQGKTLFKNVRSLIKEGTVKSEYDYAKILSSLITHAIIQSEKTGTPYKEYGVNEMYVILGKFISGDEDAINETKNFISSRYSEFILS
jgi:hypothetical protein